MESTRISFLSGSALKIIAMFAMLVDHIGYSLIEKGFLAMHNKNAIFTDAELEHLLLLDRILRGIGRIAFPIFCFVLVEGFLHTSSRIKYALRLFIFALISEIPFNYMVSGSWRSPGQQNVFFTLFIGFIVIWIWESGTTMLGILFMILGGLGAYYLNTDYSFWGVTLIAIFYTLKESRYLQILGSSVTLCWEWPALFSSIPILLYNGKRGNGHKYFFYFFYPSHIIVLYLIRMYIINYLK